MARFVSVVIEKEIFTEQGTKLVYCYGVFDSRFDRLINLMWKGDDGAKKASEEAKHLELVAAPNRPAVALIPLQRGERIHAIPGQKVIHREAA